jgi:hypothetical protein
MTDKNDVDGYEDKKIGHSEIIGSENISVMTPKINESPFLSLKMKNLFTGKIPHLDQERGKIHSKLRNSTKSMKKSVKKLNDYKDSMVTKPRPKTKKIIKTFYAPEKNPHILRYSRDVICSIPYFPPAG